MRINKVPSQDPVFQADRPRVSEINRWEQEMRINLPFALVFENLTYIGVVSRETWYVRPHYHDHFELCYVDEGEGWFAIGDFSYPVQKGDLFLTKPWEIHHGTALGNAPYRLYYLGFELSTMNSLTTAYYQLGLQRVCRDRQASARAIFNEMLMELQERQAHTLEMIQSLFLRLLVSVLRLYSQAEQTRQDIPQPLSPVIREVLSYLHGAQSPHDTTETLAARVHLSRSHLAREFKRCMGISLGQYMRTISLEWARLYLRETSTSISEITDFLGFPSIHSFSLFFKRHTGLSPLEYRKQAASQVLSSTTAAKIDEPDS